MKLILKIAAGILLASLILFGLRLLVLSAFLSGMKNVGDAALDKQRQLIVERQEKTKEAERIKIERDRQDKEKARVEAEAKRLKGVAWSKYYEEPEDCLVFQSDAHMVECVDSKKKARKEFDRLYDQGKIK